MTRSVIECREALALPADEHRCVLLRRVEALDGPARVVVTLDLRAGFGRQPMQDLKRERGTWTGRSGSLRFRWSGAGRARPDDQGQLTMTLNLAAGDHHDLVLEISDRALPAAAPQACEAWAATEESWSAMVPNCDSLIAVRDAQQAYAVLSGLSSRAGGMVAAATTSLPERMEGIRNYDYRYAWIRDQCYAGSCRCRARPASAPRSMPCGSSATGCSPTGRTCCPPTPPAAGASRPSGTSSCLAIRAGAQDREPGQRQFQLDGLGEALQLLAAAARLDCVGPEDWRAAEIAADAIEKRWAEPDAGIWELETSAGRTPG